MCCVYLLFIVFIRIKLLCKVRKNIGTKKTILVFCVAYTINLNYKSVYLQLPDRL